MSLFLVQYCENVLPRPSIVVGALLMYRDKFPENSQAFTLLGRYAECFAHADLLMFRQEIPNDLQEHAAAHPIHCRLTDVDEKLDQWGRYLIFKALDTQAKEWKNDFAESNKLDSLWVLSKPPTRSSKLGREWRLFY